METPYIISYEEEQSKEDRNQSEEYEDSKRYDPDPDEFGTDQSEEKKRETEEWEKSKKKVTPTSYRACMPFQRFYVRRS
jgi:hypothetical protein